MEPPFQAQDSRIWFDALIERNPKAIMLTDHEPRILYVNQTFEDVTGYRRAEAVGQKPSLLSSGLHGHSFYDALWIDLRQNGQWEGVVWNRRRNGELYPQALTIYPACPGGQAVYVGQFYDVSGPDSHPDRQVFYAYYDVLTELPNRQLFHSFLESRVRQITPPGKEFAVMVCDLNNFRAVNDLYGHEAGDAILQAAARRIQTLLGPGDVMARLSGDEFALLLEGAGQGKHKLLIDKLLTAFERPLEAGGYCHLSKVSLGCAVWPEHGDQPDELFRNSVRALMLAKAKGGASYAFYDPVPAEEQSRRAFIATQLDMALHQTPEQFHTVFQPIYRLRTSERVGYEVLARWNSPELPDIGPAEFIPIAESTGLIDSVTRVVLRSLVHEIRQQPTRDLPPGLFLSINVSASDIRAGNLCEHLVPVIDLLDSLNWYCVLELTESQWLAANQNNQDALAELRSRGVRIAIDDFGSGYSNLTYLNRLPVDFLKTDRSLLLPTLHRGPDNYPILRAILALAHSLALTVIVEGVESELPGFPDIADLDVLAQGYALGHPAPWSNNGI